MFALVTNETNLARWPATAVKVVVMVAAMLVEVGCKSSCFFFGQLTAVGAVVTVDMAIVVWKRTQFC